MRPLAYSASLVVIFLIATVKRITGPWIPIGDEDAWGYLFPAITWWRHGEFHTIFGRSYPYPLLLTLILRVFGDFRAIVGVQHLLGLLAAGLLVVAWNLLSTNPFVRWTCVPCVALFLFSDNLINYETSIRPEGVFSAFLAALLVASVRLLRLPSAEVFSWRGYRRGVAVVSLTILCYWLRPNFGLAVAIPPLLFMARLALAHGTPARVAVTGLAVLAISFLLIALPGRLISSRADPATQTFLPDSLFVSHSLYILSEVESDLTAGHFDRYGKDLLSMVRDSIRERIEEDKKPGSGRLPVLGLDPNALMYGSTRLERARELANAKYGGFPKFAYYYFFRFVLRQPAHFLGKVTRQLSIFYGRRAERLPMEELLPAPSGFPDDFSHTYHCLKESEGEPAELTALAAGKIYLDRLKTLGNAPPAKIQFPWLGCVVRALYALTDHSYLVLALLFLATLIARGGTSLEPVGVLALACLTMTFLMNLTGAVVVNLEASRYIDAQVVLVLASEFLCLAYLAEYAQSLWASRAPHKLVSRLRERLPASSSGP